MGGEGGDRRLELAVLVVHARQAAGRECLVAERAAVAEIVDAVATNNGRYEADEVPEPRQPVHELVVVERVECGVERIAADVEYDVDRDDREAVDVMGTR